jgi:hypothetical protein
VRALAVAAVAGAVALAMLAGSRASAETTLALPIDCRIGETCFLQNLVDIYPGPEARDFQCGDRVYDGHNGTDFRLPDRRAMEAGVAVLAAAGGTVAALRDGEPDRSFAAPMPDVTGRECGNGVVIDHGGGWETQYCHMREGSLDVAVGQPVEAGDRLGLVGASGATAFIHMHLALRRDGEVIDPFTGAAPGSLDCTDRGTPLWDAATAAALDRRPGEVINAGFADRPIEMADIEEAAFATPPAESPNGAAADGAASLPRQAPTVIFFGRAIGVLAGDRQRLTLTGPGIDIDHTEEPAERAKAQLMAFVGRRRPDGGWRPGTYRGRYELFRHGQVVSSAEAELVID